jgi:hypothetical protein
MQSGKLWRGYSFQQEYYNDAFQEMWEFSFQHLDTYNPDLQEVTTWLNDTLKRILNKYEKRRQRENARLVPKLQTAEDLFDPIDILPSPPDACLSLDLLEKLWHWVNTDSENLLQSRICTRYTHINAQTLLQRRLPPQEFSWETIAKELNADKTYLSKWYSQYCYPLLRQWAYDQGYLDPPSP